MLHSNVDSIERQSNAPGSSSNSTQMNMYSSAMHLNAASSGGQITLKCKDFRQIRIKLSNLEDLINVANSLESLSNLDDPRLFYPYFYPLNFVPLEDGWLTYDLQAEFNAIKGHSDEWRISTVNNQFKVPVGRDRLRNSSTRITITINCFVPNRFARRIRTK
jgi:hypothetical protein